MIQLLVGAVLGAGTALLFAPSTGRSTREKLKEQSKKLQYGMERLSEFADKKKQVLANKLLGFQENMECAKDKAHEKAHELKEKADELKVKAEDLKHIAGEKVESLKSMAAEKTENLKSMASEKAEDIKHLAERADALKERAVEKAEVLKKDLGELKKDFDDAIQDFRAPSDEIKSDKSEDFPPKPPTTRTSGGTF